MVSTVIASKCDSHCTVQYWLQLVELLATACQEAAAVKSSQVK